MKISQEQKRITRRKLVNAAADLFVLNGFDKTSMKQVARAAEVGDATIYKYFPNKDKLILGFFDIRGEDALDTYRNTGELESYSVAEKLQLLVDTYLEQLMADREFVEISLSQFLKSPISLLKDELSVSKSYKQAFQDLLVELDEDNSYPNIPMQSTLAALLTDALFGITLYWMKDESEGFSNTTQLCDLAIGIVDATLKSGLINKTMDIIGFIIKTHIMRGMLSGGNIISMMQEFKSAMGEHSPTSQK